MSKILYFEHNNFHLEILGTFLNYFDNLVLCAKPDLSSYLSYYQSKKRFELINYDFFISNIKENIKEFNTIIIGTFDSYSPLANNEYMKGKKVISIIHDLNDHFHTSFNMIRYTFIPNKFNYILPIHNFYKRVNYDGNTLLMVGRVTDKNRELTQLNEFIKLNKLYNIHIFCVRHREKFINLDLTDITNVKLFINRENQFLEDDIHNINYIILGNIEKKYENIFPGSIALSYNLNKPLICSKNFANKYNIKSALVYDKHINEIYPMINDKELYKNLVYTLLTEKQNIINTNNCLLSHVNI